MVKIPQTDMVKTTIDIKSIGDFHTIDEIIKITPMVSLVLNKDLKVHDNEVMLLLSVWENQGANNNCSFDEIKKLLRLGKLSAPEMIIGANEILKSTTVIAEKLCYIYSLESPSSEDIRYIGKCNVLKTRFKQHLYKATSKTKKNDWIKSLSRKGLVPVINIIDIIPFSEWQFWEKHYISLYKSWGFNLTNGTNGGDGGTMPLEIRNKSREKSRKKILQYDRDGNFIKEWDSLVSAKREYNMTNSTLWSALNDVRPTCKNFLWRYKLSENYPKKIERFPIAYSEMPKVIEFRKRLVILLTGKKFSQEQCSNLSKSKMGIASKKRKPIIQYDSEGNIVKEWESITLADKYSGVKKWKIHYCLNGKKKYTEFSFKYKTQ